MGFLGRLCSLIPPYRPPIAVTDLRANQAPQLSRDGQRVEVQRPVDGDWNRVFAMNAVGTAHSYPVPSEG